MPSRPALAMIALLLQWTGFAQAAPFDDLKSGIEAARKNNGGVVQCDPTLAYNFARNVIELPSNITIHGNGATFKSDKIAPHQGSTQFFLSNTSTGITIEGVNFVSEKSLTTADRTGVYGLDVKGGSNIRLTNCTATGMLGLIHVNRGVGVAEPVEHVTVRDCRVEDSYYSVAFSTPVKHAQIMNLYCKNVIRGFIAIGAQNVRVQMTVEHDGKSARFDPCLIKSQPTDKIAYETDGIVADVTVIGTVGLRRIVQIEFQGPPNMLPSHIRDVDVTCRVIGTQGACALVGFANFEDGATTVEMTSLGKHEMKRIVVRGNYQFGSVPVDPKCLLKPPAIYFVHDGSVW